MEKDTKFWDHNDAEILYHNDIDEAIEAYLDEREPLPLTVEMLEYERETINVESPGLKYLLSNILENLDEEYGNPDGDYTKPTKKMERAASILKQVIVDEYVPWRCTTTGKREVIDCKKWVKENRPDWIKDGVKFEGEL